MKTYESIVKGQQISKPGVPESFRVLVKELQALGLDMKVLDENDEEIKLEDMDDDARMNFNDVEKMSEKKRILNEYSDRIAELSGEKTEAVETAVEETEEIQDSEDTEETLD